MSVRPRRNAYSPLVQWLLLGAALLILGGAIGWNLYAEHDAIDAGERERLAVHAAIVEKNITPQLLLANKIIEGVLKELPSRGPQGDGFGHVDHDLQVLNRAMTGIRPILVIAADGTVIASSNKTLVGQNFAHREYFKTALKNPDPEILHVSAPFKTVLDTFVISLSRVSRGPKGEFAGLVIVSAVPEYFSTLLDSILYAPDMRASIVHGDGKIFLTSPPAGLDGKDLAIPGSLFTRHREGGQPSSVFAGTVYSTGEERLMAHRSIQLTAPAMDTPLVVAVSRDLHAIFAPWRQRAFEQAGLFVLLVLASTLGLQFHQQRQRVYESFVADRELEQQRTEKILQASEKRFRTLLEEIPAVSVQGYGPDGTTHYWNKASERLYGYSAEEAIGRNLLDLIIPPEMHQGVRQAIGRMFESGQPIPTGELSLRHKDGSRVDVVSSHAYVHVPGEAPEMFCVDFDLTERKRAEQELETTKKRLELALSGGDLGLWDWHIPGAEVLYSGRWYSMLGYSREELGSDLDSWTKLIHPDDLASVKAALDSHLKGKTPAYECEHRVRRKDGQWLWLFDRGKVVEWDEAGAPVRAVGTYMDITERKRAEAELLRSNAELEQFSYSISHDMRQPLRMISSYMQLLQMGLADQLDAEKREYFDFAIDGARRLDRMLVALLDYSRVGRKGEPATWVESREILDEALLFLRPAVAEAQGTLSVTGDWPRVFVSRDEILRLVQNLIGNALKFRVAGRRPEIAIRSEVLADTAGSWCLSVTDNGIGILPGQIGRLFQVFQRLQSRAAYEGTGIGLALCRKIAEHHGGSIRAESAGEGRGSTFRLELPLPAGETPARSKTA